jgi:queuine tRNA-ribosyltransferase
MPTRNGRNGMLFTRNGVINIKNKKWENDFSPIDPDGESFVDQKYTKAYVRHLFAAREMLGPIIASLHNLNFYLWLVREARKQILEGSFTAWKDGMVGRVDMRI